MKKIYIARRNPNVNDGNAPMVNVIAFFKEGNAAQFINGKPGIQGLRRDWAKDTHGDWDIQELAFVLADEKVTSEMLRLTMTEDAISFLEKYGAQIPSELPSSEKAKDDLLASAMDWANGGGHEAGQRTWEASRAYKEALLREGKK